MAKSFTWPAFRVWHLRHNLCCILPASQKPCCDWEVRKWNSYIPTVPHHLGWHKSELAQWWLTTILSFLTEDGTVRVGGKITPPMWLNSLDHSQGRTPSRESELLKFHILLVLENDKGKNYCFWLSQMPHCVSFFHFLWPIFHKQAPSVSFAKPYFCFGIYSYSRRSAW